MPSAAVRGVPGGLERANDAATGKLLLPPDRPWPKNPAAQRSLETFLAEQAVVAGRRVFQFREEHFRYHLETEGSRALEALRKRDPDAVLLPLGAIVRHCRRILRQLLREKRN